MVNRLRKLGGAVNMYGLDSYPGGFSCININSGFSLVRNYYQWFANYSFHSPTILLNLKVDILRLWGEASMMIALQSMIQAT
jgi:hypothetical protein